MAKVRKRSWGDGKEAWVVDYTDRNKKRRVKTFPIGKKKAADAYLHNVRTELMDGTHIAPSASKSVAEAVPGWLHDAENGSRKRGKLEATTVREYKRHARYLTDPITGIGNMKLSELSYGDVDDFEERLFKAGKSRATIKAVRSSLSALLSDAEIKRAVSKNIVRDMPRQKKPYEDRENREPEPPSKEDINALIHASQDRFRAILVTLVFTGMRISEVRGLYWDSVNFDTKRIRVRQRADRYGTIGNPKTKKGTRTIPMSPMVVKTLRKWKLQCPPGDVVFPSRNGNVLAHSNLEPMFSRLQRRLGISRSDGKPFGFHALRHAAASLFIEQGFNPKKVQELMGHASIQMTYDRYGHLFHDEGDDEAFANIESSVLATTTRQSAL